MILDLLLRSGIVVAVIVATKRAGIWDSSDDTQDTYDAVTGRAKPYAKEVCEYLNIRVPPLPPQREKTYLGIYVYNQTVITIFNFLHICPTYITYVVERVPGLISEYATRARERYARYKREREEEKEKKERKKRNFDQSKLIETIEPYPEPKCKCKEEVKERNPGLMPKCVPPSPYKEAPCPKVSEPCLPKKP